MRLLFHAPPFDPSALSLYENLSVLDGIQQSDYIKSSNHLLKYLRNPMGISTLVVLWPSSQDELLKLRKKSCLFRDMRIILILPDRQADTISEGHLFRPRFVGYADGELSDIVAVVAKLTNARKTTELQAAR